MNSWTHIHSSKCNDYTKITSALTKILLITILVVWTQKAHCLGSLNKSHMIFWYVTDG